jgi:hypothetical protein
MSLLPSAQKHWNNDHSPDGPTSFNWSYQGCFQIYFTQSTNLSMMTTQVVPPAIGRLPLSSDRASYDVPMDIDNPTEITFSNLMHTHLPLHCKRIPLESRNATGKITGKLLYSRE